MSFSNKRILNLSALDYGGAGKFSVDFHHLMQTEGADSYLVVEDAKTANATIIQYPDLKFTNFFGKLLRRFYKQKLVNNVFAYDFYFYNKYERYSVVSAKKILALLPSKPDIIFVHWVTDFVNAKLLHELKILTGAKIYCLLIDNAPLTGGCHYPWGCKGFITDCSGCPAIVSDQYKWISVSNLAFKKKYLHVDIGVIAFSESDYNRACQSTLFRDHEIVKLIGYVNEDLFKPGDIQNARNYFGLPANKKVLFFGASSLQEKRKGMKLLLDALSLLDGEEVFVLMAGKLSEVPTTISIKHVGYLSESELILAYQAADVFVCPSIEDSGPMMINQSLMCGTPVVAFNTGVAQDLVITGKTGYKVITIDHINLAEGIKNIIGLSTEEQGIMSENCRTYAEELFSKHSYISKLQLLIN